MRPQRCHGLVGVSPGASFADLVGMNAHSRVLCARRVWSGIERMFGAARLFERRSVMTRKNILSLAAAAALSVGGLALAQDDKNAAERAADKTGRAAERAGDKIGQA